MQSHRGSMWVITCPRLSAIAKIVDGNVSAKEGTVRGTVGCTYQMWYFSGMDMNDLRQDNHIFMDYPAQTSAPVLISVTPSPSAYDCFFQC